MSTSWSVNPSVAAAPGLALGRLETAEELLLAACRERHSITRIHDCILRAGRQLEAARLVITSMVAPPLRKPE